MAKTAKIATNFTGGEISPSLAGRVDVAKYANGTARMENFYPRVQGGARGRDGSRDMGQARGDGRLLPFVYSREVAYQLEMTDHCLRIWRGDGTRVLEGTSPLELATPYSLAELWDVEREQGDDTLFLFHVDHPTMRVQRLADATWTIEETPWVVQPFSEQGFFPDTLATISDVSVGAGRVFNISAAVLLDGDVGRTVLSAGLGEATITDVVSGGSALVDVTRTFSHGTLEDGWSITGSPQAFIYPSSKEPVGAVVRIDSALARAGSITLSGTGGVGTARTVVGVGTAFVVGDVGKKLYADAGVILLDTFTNATHVSGTLASTADFLLSVYQSGAWGVTGDAFRSTDVGAYIRALGTGALYKITGFVSATQVDAEIRTSASALVVAPPGSWELQTNDWGSGGYPRTGALHEQRLWVAGTRSDPRGIWASKLGGEYLDFEPGLLDTSAFHYDLLTPQRNPILHLAVGKVLFAMASGLEVSLKGGNEKAIGPTNIQKTIETSHGASKVRPVAIGKEVIFVQGAGKKVHAIGYSPGVDGFDSPDRTVFADHITGAGIVDMAFASQPDTLLYCVRTDGQMAVCAYSVEQEVIAWSRFVTDGLYRSVSVIPRPTRDDVWTLVRRGTAEIPLWRIERFEPTLKTDGASTLASSPTVSWSGLTHLANRTVAVKLDGIYQGQLLVGSGGALTTLRTGSMLEAGLPYVPEIEMLPPELGSADSTMQGSNLSVHEVVVRLLNTAAFEINGELSDFRRFGNNLLDRPPPGFDGDYRVITLTDDVYISRLVIRQPLPLDCHVLAVIRKVSANDI